MTRESTAPFVPVAAREAMQLRPTPAVPDDKELAERFRGRAAPDDIAALRRWLVDLVPARIHADGVAVLRAGVRWLRRHGGDGEGAASLRRLHLLLDVLDAVPAWRHAFADVVAATLGGLDPGPFFEEALPSDRGVLYDTMAHFAKRLLPTMGDGELGALVAILAPHARDATWLAALPPDVVSRLVHLLADGGRDPWWRVRRGLHDAIALVALRTAGLGLSSEVRARSPDVPLAASPFYLLPRLCDAFLAGVGSIAACREQILACRAVVDDVEADLDANGASADVAYRLEGIARRLDRLDELLMLVAAPTHGESVRRATALLGRLAALRATGRSLGDLLRTSCRLVARRAVEHAGARGEHYIAATRAAYWRLLASAAGGGLLTAGTTIAKLMILGWHLPLFVEGAMASSNYALSFVLMQVLGFSLATKQSSHTAATLAQALKDEDTDAEAVVTLVARAWRSQLGAVVANLVTVAPAALAVDLAVRHATGHPLLDAARAEHVVRELDPFASGTIFFAVLTGVHLWLSSLCGGWLENFAAFRRLGESVRGRGRLFRAVVRQVVGAGASVSLGILMGMTPVVGRFLGVPLEVRHVTLSTGSLALAASTLGWEHGAIGMAAVGVVCVGILNFAVSFSLALFVALRTLPQQSSTGRILLGVLGRMMRRPLEFVVPRG